MVYEHLQDWIDQRLDLILCDNPKVSQQRVMVQDSLQVSKGRALCQVEYRNQTVQSNCSYYPILKLLSFFDYSSKTRILHLSGTWLWHRKSWTTWSSHWYQAWQNGLTGQTLTTYCQRLTAQNSCFRRNFHFFCWCCSLWDERILNLWDPVDMAHWQIWQDPRWRCKLLVGLCLLQVHKALYRTCTRW